MDEIFPRYLVRFDTFRLPHHFADVLVVGTGVAGYRAALRAAHEGARVVLLAKGQTTAEVTRKLGITEQTYYRWRQKYGGMQPEMTREFKALQKENARLKKLVAEQALDMEILKEAARGN